MVDLAKIQIVHCTDIQLCERLTELEARIWGDSERNLTPGHISLIAAKTGGQALAATLGEEWVGFSLAFVGARDGAPYLHSHLTGVLPAYQNCGIGRQLKMAQRVDALARGFKLMEWTFDPFALRNAWFNLVKLGATVRRFIPNLYGITESSLHGGLPTDRWLAEWRMDSVRVREALAGQPLRQSSESERAVEFERVLVPNNLHQLSQQDAPRALALQAELSQRFVELFADGWVAVDLELHAGHGSYVFVKAAALDQQR